MLNIWVQGNYFFLEDTVAGKVYENHKSLVKITKDTDAGTSFYIRNVCGWQKDNIPVPFTELKKQGGAPWADQTEFETFYRDNTGNRNGGDNGDGVVTYPGFNSSTGLKTGGMITVNGGDPAKFDISAGEGLIVDPITGVETPVSWDPIIGVTPSFLATQDASLVYIDETGTEHMEPLSAFPDSEDIRCFVPLGVVGHPSHIQIDAIFLTPISIANPVSKLHDLLNAIGSFSINGNKITKETGALSLNKSAGTSFLADGNFQVNPKNPSWINAGVLASPILAYVKQDQFLGDISADIDTLQWDDGGTLTTLANNKFVAHRVWHQPGNNILFFQYGQQFYDSLTDARNGYEGENFVFPQALNVGAYVVEVIIVRKGITNLDNPLDSEIIPQGKFGGGGGGVIQIQNITNAEMLALPTPVLGFTIYNTDEKKHYSFDGDVWLCPGLVKCTNGEATVKTTGQPVRQGASDTDVLLSSTQDSVAIVGVVKDVYGGGGIGTFLTVCEGEVHMVDLNGTVNRGELIFQSTTAGQAYSSGFTGSGAFGITRGTRSGVGSSLVPCFLTPTERF